MPSRRQGGGGGQNSPPPPPKKRVLNGLLQVTILSVVPCQLFRKRNLGWLFFKCNVNVIESARIKRFLLQIIYCFIRSENQTVQKLMS